MKPAASSQGRSIPLVAVTGSLVLGGSTTFLLNLSRAFAARGLQLPIVSLSENNGHAADFARTGNPPHCISHSKWIYEDRLSIAYQEVARHSPPAVLSCLGPESFEILRLLPPGVTRLGVVQSHDPGWYETASRYAPYLDGIAGVSHAIEQQLLAMPALARARVACIPYGIQFTQGEAPARSLDQVSPLRMIYVGRLVEEQKRVSRLIALAQILAAQGVNVEFTIVGTGPEEAALRHALAHLKWVHFTGPVPNEHTPALWQAHDVSVLLSDYEGLPLSLLEAMGQGVVPVVSDLPSGMRDAVNDECGFRVPIGDVSRAGEVISWLATHRGELATRSRLAARFAREHYSADRMAGRYLELIQALQKPGGRWPEKVEIPVPLGLQPWLYSGLVRKVRRRLKPFLRR